MAHTFSVLPCSSVPQIAPIAWRYESVDSFTAKLLVDLQIFGVATVAINTIDKMNRDAV